MPVLRPRVDPGTCGEGPGPTTPQKPSCQARGLGAADPSPETRQCGLCRVGPRSTAAVRVTLRSRPAQPADPPPGTLGDPPLPAANTALVGQGSFGVFVRPLTGGCPSTRCTRRSAVGRCVDWQRPHSYALGGHARDRSGGQVVADVFEAARHKVALLVRDQMVR